MNVLHSTPCTTAVSRSLHCCLYNELTRRRDPGTRTRAPGENSAPLPSAPPFPPSFPRQPSVCVLRINFFRSFMIGSSRFVPRFYFVSFLDRFNVRFILISRFSANLIPPRISTNRLAFLLFSSYFLVVKTSKQERIERIELFSYCLF